MSEAANEAVKSSNTGTTQDSSAAGDLIPSKNTAVDDAGLQKTSPAFTFVADSSSSVSPYFGKTFAKVIFLFNQLSLARAVTNKNALSDPLMSFAARLFTTTPFSPQQ